MTNTTVATTTVFAYESTLLIPESVAWMPYLGLVVVVFVALGLDFYKFHQKNRVKYACMKEHASIVSHSPKRQRICMISGVGLRFKKGKPVLGEVWNTSPSSSEISSYSPWREAGRQSGQGHSEGDNCYSMEITPSDDGGVTAPGFYDRERVTSSGLRPESCSGNPFRSLLNSDDDEDAYREPTAWSLGGEVIATGSTNRERTGDVSQNSYGFSVLGSEVEGQSQGRGQTQGQKQKQVVTSVTSVTVEPSRNQTSTPVGEVAGPSQRQFQDASTQTDPMQVSYNIDLSDPPPQYVAPLRLGSGGGGGSSQRRGGGHESPRHSSHQYLGEYDYTEGGACPSPRPHSPYYSSHSGGGGVAYGSYAHKNTRRMTLGGAGLSPPDSQPTVIDFSPRSHSIDRSRDSPNNPATPRQPRSKFEGRRKHELGLDIFSSPRSPTTEIVAKDHGFELAGVEVPYVPGMAPAMSSNQQGGSGNNSGGGGGSGTSMFKAPGMQVQGKSFIRPVVKTPSASSGPGSGGFKYKTESSSALSEAAEFGSAHQRSSYRRVHSLSMEMDESHAHHPSSARSLPAVPPIAIKSGSRKQSHGQMRTPHSSRPSSASPRPRKEKHSRSKQSLGGGVDDGGGGRDDDVMREEELEDVQYKDGGGGSSRPRGSVSPRHHPPVKTSTAPGGLDESEELEFRPIPHGNSVKHPQLRHQREPKETRQHQQHQYQQQQQHYHHERRDGYHKRKLSSQSFSAGSGSTGLNRRKSERSRSGSGGGGGDKGLKPTSPSIPSHLYHEDEEGFFSSSAAAAHAALNRGVSSNMGQDQHRKGILFFSRLAGAGRHASEMSSSGTRKSGGGGFES